MAVGAQASRSEGLDRGHNMQRYDRSSVWVVCAAYNEATTISRVVGQLRRDGYSVVVVDDGSRDDTRQRAATATAVVVHPINLGQGAALKTGIDYALAQGASIVVTFDADGQHRAAEIALLIEPLLCGRADIALGSRFLGPTQAIPIMRRLLLKAATWFTRLTTGLRLTDTHNGLRAFTRRGAQALKLRQNRMAHASEILSDIAASGLRYVEVPVTVDYTAYSLAKGQRAGDAVVVLLDLFAQRLHR
jgi:polyprenyl-phospho-N-acetylgalactosaminyl synthase